MSTDPVHTFSQAALAALESGATVQELEDTFWEAVEEHQAPEVHIGGGPKP